MIRAGADTRSPKPSPSVLSTYPVPCGVHLAAIVPRTEMGAVVSSRLFPAFSTMTINAMERVANVMNVRTTTAHGFKNGQIVTIDGMPFADSTLEGQYVIIDGQTIPDRFTYASVGANLSITTSGNATGGVVFSSSNTEPGFYGYLATGEKVVNAPLTLAGITFFGTNRPFSPANNTCASNLGEARGYVIDPFSGARRSVVYDGGGLPPSPVSGIVRIVNPISGVVTSEQFCISCGGTSGASGGEAGMTVDPLAVSNSSDGSLNGPPACLALGTCLSWDDCTVAQRQAGLCGYNPACSGSTISIQNAGICRPVSKLPTRTYWFRR